MTIRSVRILISSALLVLALWPVSVGETVVLDRQCLVECAEVYQWTVDVYCPLVLFQYGQHIYETCLETAWFEYWIWCRPGCLGGCF